jgi:hypothetical protein
VSGREIKKRAKGRGRVGRRRGEESKEGKARGEKGERERRERERGEKGWQLFLSPFLLPSPPPPLWPPSPPLSFTHSLVPNFGPEGTREGRYYNII